MQEAYSFFRSLKNYSCALQSRVLSILAVSLLLLVSSSVYSQTYPLMKDKYINDYAGILTPGSRKRIRKYLLTQVKQNRRFMTLMIINSLSDYGKSLTIESLATELFSRWEASNALKNKGVLILISKQDGKIRIELGKGYSRQREASMRRVIDTVMVPRFKLERFNEGIESGIRSIDATLDFSPELLLSAEPRSLVRQFIEGIPRWAYAILGIFGSILIWPHVKHYLRYRPRTCKKCQSKMERLDDKREDMYLDEGNLLEEKIESVDYDVWLCRNCLHILITRYSDASEYEVCPECSYQTLEVEYEIIESATDYSEGEERFDYHCLKCQFTETQYKVIPVKDLDAIG